MKMHSLYSQTYSYYISSPHVRLPNRKSPPYLMEVPEGIAKLETAEIRFRDVLKRDEIKDKVLERVTEK